MAKVTVPVTNFTAGEISPRLDMRVDTQKYRNGAKTIENGIVMPHGGIRKRGGTKFIAEVKESSNQTWLTPFEFNVTQAYMLEVGPLYIRQFKDLGVIIGTSKAITGITNANPAVVTSTAHGYSNGDQVYISGVLGMTQVNNRRFEVASAMANSFQLNGVNSTSYGVYTSGGVAEKPTETVTAYTSDEADDLNYAQSADTLYLAHNNHQVAKLTRTSHTNWTLADTDIINGPFRTINTDNTHYMSVVVTGSASISGATQTNPVVVTTSSAHPFEEGATLSIAGVVGMTQLNGNRYIARNVTSTTFELWSEAYAKIDGTGYGAYSSGGTAATDKSTWETISPGSKVTLTSTAAFFTSDHVGALIRLWEPGKSSSILAPPVGMAFNTLASGQQYTKDKHVYGTLNFSGSSSDWQRISDFPSHESGVVHFRFNDAHNIEADVVFLHDSFSVLEIIAYTSSTVVTARVKTGHIPKSVATDNSAIGTFLWEEGAWSDERGYPALIGFHEGRFYAASSTADPQTIWASKSQAFEDFQDGADDNDALTYAVASGKVDKFKWMMPGKALAFGTPSNEYVAAASSQNEALTPSNVRIVPQTPFGSAGSIRPVKINNVILFGQRRGLQSNAAKRIREFAYAFEADQYQAPDLTIVSEHITGPGVTKMTYQADPDSLVWCVREDGPFATLTYESEQDVKGWHRHIIGGSYLGGDPVIEDAAVIPGPDQDETWLIVKRTIGGVTKRYIEVLSRGLTDQTEAEDCAYLDSYATYDGAETSTVTGLWHLEGETVYALADGAKQGPFTVANGSITLSTPASKVHAGLQYTTIIETLDLEAGAQGGTAKSRQKRISEVFLDIYRSLGGRVGPDEDTMHDIVYRTPQDVFGAAPALHTGLERFEFPGGWDHTAQIRIEHDEPYPFTLLGICVEQDTSG